MEIKKASLVVKTIDDCRTLLDFLNIFYKDKRIKTVKVTSSFFKSHKIMEDFWDWMEAQEIPEEKVKFLIADIGTEKQKYLSKSPLKKINFKDTNDGYDDDDENTMDYLDEEVG